MFNKKEYNKQWRIKNKKKYTKYQKKWRERNKSHIKEYHEQYMKKYLPEILKPRNRKFKLNTYENGKKIILKVLKRDFPKDSCCELCRNKKSRLSYHHWKIKNNKAYGLWLCHFCHGFAEKTDDGIKQQDYENLKQKISAEF